MDYELETKKYIKRKQKAFAEGNRIQQAVNCSRLGDIYNERGQYQDALKEYEEEAKIYEKLHKRLEMARAERMVGEMQMMLGSFEEAKIHIRKYLENVKILKNEVEEQRAYATLGRLHLLHGQNLTDTSSKNMTQFREAEKAFLKSLLLTKKLSGKASKIELLDMQARCYLNIGIVKEHMEDFDESIANIEKAIQICKTYDIFELTHQCYISLSLLYYHKKNDACTALRFCNQALDVAKRLPQKVKKICETLFIKAEIFIKEGDFSSAKQILTKAYKKNTPNENDRNDIEKLLKIVIKLCKLLDDLVTASSTDYVKCKRIYEQLGDGCCQLENYSKALEFYNQMYECAQQNQESGKALIPIYVSLYQTYKDMKQYDRALEYLWKEFELNKDEPSEACSTLCSVAEVCELQMQPFWTIQDIYRQAKEYASKASRDKRELEKIVYVRLRNLQLKHGMNVLAEDLRQEAITKGIDLEHVNDSDSDADISGNEDESNVTNLEDDINLSNLSDSDVSDSDETDKPRPCRTKRGTRSLLVKRNNKGESQLHQACISGNIELVRHLVEQGHPLNVRDHAGWLPLHEASNHGFREIVEFLLDRGACTAINDKGGTSCDGITPLYDACCNGYLDVAELLLDRGADVTVKTDFGETCVDALDKWRRASTVTDGEIAHYESLRTRMLKSVSVVTGSKPSTHPLQISLYDEEDDDEDEMYSTYYEGSVTEEDSLLKSQQNHSRHEMRAQFKEARVLPDREWQQKFEHTRPNKKRPCYQTKLTSKPMSLPASNKSQCSEFSTSQSDALMTERDKFEMFMETVVHPTKKTKLRTSHTFKRPRSKSPSSESSEKENETPGGHAPSVEPDSTTALLQQSLLSTTISPVHIAPVVASSVSFKVKIEDELFLIPIDRNKLNDTDMRWLADEAAKRYYNLVGFKPLLRLRTTDGFAFADTDCVIVAVQHNVIVGSVLEWHTLPLGQRYEEICRELSLGPHKEVESALQMSEMSNSIRLKDLWLNPLECQAVLKAIMHQKNIRILDLNNNFLQDEGCRQLAKCLPTLKHLKTLNLKGNCISADGLDDLLTSLRDAPKPQNLEELILSRNPLGNAAVPLLHKFCNSTAGSVLKKLHLSNCNISQLGDCNLCFSQLVDFDISFNPLTNESSLKMMRHLNSSLLHNINISFCQPSLPHLSNDNSSFGDFVNDFFESGSCERFRSVQLANCRLSDVQMYKIIKCLSRSIELALVDISDNRKLTPTALNFIIKNLPQLRKLIALNCSNLLTSADTERLRYEKRMPQFVLLSVNETYNKLEELKHLWQTHWKEKAKMKTLNNQLVLYINDGDLNQCL